MGSVKENHHFRLPRHSIFKMCHVISAALSVERKLEFKMVDKLGKFLDVSSVIV